MILLSYGLVDPAYGVAHKSCSVRIETGGQKPDSLCALPIPNSGANLQLIIPYF